MYIVYESDNFHSVSSSVVIGLFDNKAVMEAAVFQEIISLSDQNDAQWQWEYFKTNNQTQGLNKEQGIDIRVEEIELNTIIK